MASGETLVGEVIPVQRIMSNDPTHARLPHAALYDQGAAYVNDTYCSIATAAVPISDLGFMQADGAYDVASASKGFIFRLDDHLDRFELSCARFRLKNPHNKRATAEILMELLRLTGIKDAYIWWAVTRGQRPQTDRTNPSAYANCFYAFVVPYLFLADDEIRQRGINLIVSRDYIRIPSASVDARAKNFHWMDLKLSLFEARDHGGDWSVLCDNEGFLTEAPGANIFLFDNDVLWTPQDGCLEGITRRTVIDLADEIGLSVRVERLHVDRLRDAQEAFITSTAGGIMPVSKVDGAALKGTGETVTRLHDLYWTKRWQGWHGTRVNY